MLAEAAVAWMLAGMTPAAPCRTTLPDGPRVPAPLVLRTSCGSFLLAADGGVTRLPPRWPATHSGGTGRRYGADLQLRRNRPGRVVLLRRGRLVWRSRDLYPNTGGDVAFGPGSFAFASYARGVYLTDLRRPERLVVAGRGLFPYAFFASGRLIVIGGGQIRVLDTAGRVERRYRYRPNRGVSFDANGDTLYFATRDGRLATLHEVRLRVGRRLANEGSFGFVASRRLLFYGTRSLMLASLDGRPLARARWPRGRLDNLDSGAVVSADARYVAYRLSDTRPGARKGTAVLFVLRASGAKPQAVLRHRLGPTGCAVGASMHWHGHHLLYGSLDGRLAVVDARRGRPLDLTALAAALPRRGSWDRAVATWQSDWL